MKSLTCECGFEVKGATEQEVLDGGMKHIQEAHPDKAQGVTPESLKANIKDVA